MRVRNVHERNLPVPPETAGALIDGLSGENDRLWPTVRHGRTTTFPPDWPALRMDGPLAVGARGGHGPVRYTVEGYEPGRLVRFRFRAPRGFDGFHEFTVHPAPRGGSVLRHLLAIRPRGIARLTWPLVFRPLHDALLEDGLDRAEHEVTGAVRAPARWSPYVRLLRSLMRVATPSAAVRTG